MSASGSAIEFMDCNTYIGRPANPKFFPDPVTPGVLTRELSRLGIARSLVTHALSREYSPKAGNALLTQDLADYPHLAPCLTLLPTHTRELYPAEDIPDVLRQTGARAVRIFPSMSIHRYPLDHRVLGDVFSVLEKHRVPLLIDFDLGRRDEADWRALYDIAERYPELRTLVIRPGGRSDRGLYPLLTMAPHAHIETGGYWVHSGIETICERFGAERLVFGSGFPYWTMSGAVYHVQAARISEAERHLIASRNLQRLMAGVQL